LTQVIGSVMLPARNKIVYLSDAESDDDCGDATLRFRLVYSGKLLSTQGGERCGRPERRPEHKHDIRKYFHKQLKRLWEIDRFLHETQVVTSREDTNASRLVGEGFGLGSRADVKTLMSEVIANKYRENGYRFVPLVREQDALSCNIDVLFLRADYPYSVFSAGDVDNRIKTLIDSLCKPKNADALRQNAIPADGEDPFYCLLEDDKLITGFKVETDQLLNRSDANEQDRSWAELVIGVEIRPSVVTNLNAGFL
jgi:hypothetical protein